MSKNHWTKFKSSRYLVFCLNVNVCYIIPISFFFLKYRPEENLRLDFRLWKTDETINYFLDKKNQRDLMSKKHKNVCMVLNYI